MDAPTGVEATDTAAIQGKLTAAAAGGGGTVRLRTGTYLINAPLSIGNFVTLAGQGNGARSSEYGIDTPGSSILKLGGTKDFNVIENADSTNGNSAIVLRDFAMHLNVTPAADIAAVQFTKARRSRFVRVAVLGGATTTRRGFYFLNCEIALIHQCSLEGMGIFSTNSTNSVRLSQCEIGQGCVFLRGGFGHHLIGNEIYKDGVSSDDAIGDCIRLDTVRESVFAFNNIRGAWNGHGIQCVRAVNRCVIHGNHVYENGRKTAGVFSGITLDSDVAAPTEKNVVTGNVCYDRQATKTQQYGIQVKSFVGTQTNHNLIANNMLLDNRSADALNIGTAGLVNTYRDNLAEYGAL